MFLLLQIFRGAAAVLCCDVFAATNILRRCRWFSVVMFLLLQIFCGAAAGFR